MRERVGRRRWCSSNIIWRSSSAAREMRESRSCLGS
uniref:Uncharacterized protein n=1 Tax=Rhizophora mucronata TaxID=61149 RepID=A0A2P2Q7V4_RHIMU